MATSSGPEHVVIPVKLTGLEREVERMQQMFRQMQRLNIPGVGAASRAVYSQAKLQRQEQLMQQSLQIVAQRMTAAGLPLPSKGFRRDRVVETPYGPMGVTARYDPVGDARKAEKEAVTRTEQARASLAKKEAERQQIFLDEKKARLASNKRAHDANMRMQATADQEMDAAQRDIIESIRQANRERLARQSTHHRRMVRAEEAYWTDFSNAQQEAIRGLPTRRARRQAQERLAGPQERLDLQEAELARRRRRRLEATERLERMRMNRERRMTQATMGLASTSIGLFGQAGFPMLNIGFAAMSGMPYAGIAAVATAIGELSRMIMRLQDAAMQSSESIGFVTDEFKKNKAIGEATKGFYGGLLNEIKGMGIQDVSKMYRDPNRVMAEINRDIRLMFLRQNMTDFWKTGVFRNPETQAQQFVVRLPDILAQSAINAENKLRPFKSQTYTDAQAIRQRMQSALLSRVPDERRIAMEQLEELRKLRQIAEKEQTRINEIRSRMTPGERTVEGMGRIFRGYTY